MQKVLQQKKIVTAKRIFQKSFCLYFYEHPFQIWRIYVLSFKRY